MQCSFILIILITKNSRLPLDPRGKRYIIKCKVTEPFLVKGMEFISFEIKGQSFMLHQIRKMVSLVIGISRGIADESVFEKVFSTEKIRVPTAPSLGLFLDRVSLLKYNKKNVLFLFSANETFSPSFCRFIMNITTINSGLMEYTSHSIGNKPKQMSKLLSKNTYLIIFLKLKSKSNRILFKRKDTCCDKIK